MSALSAVPAINVTLASSGPGKITDSSPSRSTGIGPAAFEAEQPRGDAVAHSAPKAEASANPYSKFEAMVISQLVSTMLSSSGENLFGEKGGMQAFSSVFAGAIGDEMAKHGGIGLADLVARITPEASGK
ncbi:MAG: rod-binding protein [Salaquimonas sp.]|jgi:Rod binding domain-containing protein|nr:rod-binding protein [Salaquimonas sp.]